MFVYICARLCTLVQNVEARCIWGRENSAKPTRTSLRPSRTTMSLVVPGMFVVHAYVCINDCSLMHFVCRRLACLKYLVLANMLMKSGINPFDSQEVLHFAIMPFMVFGLSLSLLCTLLSLLCIFLFLLCTFLLHTFLSLSCVPFSLSCVPLSLVRVPLSLLCTSLSHVCTSLSLSYFEGKTLQKQPRNCCHDEPCQLVPERRHCRIWEDSKNKQVGGKKCPTCCHFAGKLVSKCQCALT